MVAGAADGLLSTKLAHERRGFNRIQPDSTGFNRIQLDSTGFKRIQQDSTGFNRSEVHSCHVQCCISWMFAAKNVCYRCRTDHSQMLMSPSCRLETVSSEVSFWRWLQVTRGPPHTVRSCGARLVAEENIGKKTARYLGWFLDITWNG